MLWLQVGGGSRLLEADMTQSALLWLQGVDMANVTDDMFVYTAVHLLGQNPQTHTRIFPRPTRFDSKQARTSETSVTLPTFTKSEDPRAESVNRLENLK